MVGGRSREPRPQYCRPGEPAIANHQTHHEVNKELSLRLGASGARNRSPRTLRATEKERLWLAALVVRLQF